MGLDPRLDPRLDLCDLRGRLWPDSAGQWFSPFLMP